MHAIHTFSTSTQTYSHKYMRDQTTARTHTATNCLLCVSKFSPHNLPSQWTSFYATPFTSLIEQFFDDCDVTTASCIQKLLIFAHLVLNACFSISFDFVFFNICTFQFCRILICMPCKGKRTRGSTHAHRKTNSVVFVHLTRFSLLCLQLYKR